ncbi:hypothetical protein [Vreelandella nigrificans]|uniref:hypothetical protein n=1 Tax=Vreelandella nigrificans TaxID=2042704 RepID=UPI0013FDD215|nr:hypothetical protein [Halomonas nigrificans]
MWLVEGQAWPFTPVSQDETDAAIRVVVAVLAPIAGAVVSLEIHAPIDALHEGVQPPGTLAQDVEAGRISRIVEQLVNFHSHCLLQRTVIAEKNLPDGEVNPRLGRLMEALWISA